MKLKNLNYFFLSILVLFCLTSCTKTIGYSVVLWGNEDNQLHDGELVKVLVKSNITHSYIIELPGSRENKEIPLWQLSNPESKSKAKKTAEKYAEYANTFAYVKLDGLPVRADSVNTAKQVYRLRKGEIIRVLFKGDGAAVTNGKGNMTGEWYRVLTPEGTQGWCFSYNLDIYESTENGKREEIAKIDEADAPKDDKNLQILRSKRWYPAEYRQLIKKNTIDLQVMNSSYGFTFEEPKSEGEQGKIVLATYDTEKSWKFNSIRKLSSKQYQFDGANVNVTVKGEDEIVVQYMESGKPKNSIFASFDADVLEIISKENTRRNDEIAKVLGKFSSENYGILTITGRADNYSFNWANYSLLSPAIIPGTAKGTSRIKVNYLLSDSLKGSYDGILSFDFGGTEVNFLYKMTNGGLRLEDATKATIKDNIVTKRSPSPVIIFFESK